MQNWRATHRIYLLEITFTLPGILPRLKETFETETIDESLPQSDKKLCNK